MEASYFFVNRDIDKIINETELAVTTELESGDRQKAMKRLRVPPLGKIIDFAFTLINSIAFSHQVNNKVHGRHSKLDCSRGVSWFYSLL